MTHDYPWYLLALIPIICGAIGYVTNVVAVKMMFYPVEFIGIRPYLGWQGIVPANAVRLAKKGLSLVTDKLLAIPDIFKGVDSASFLGPVEGELRQRTREVVDTEAQERFSAMWGMLGDSVKGQVHDTAWSEVRAMSGRVINEVIARMPQILDMQRVVVTAVSARPELLNRMFLEIGTEEFKFIERSGWWFGLGFGMIQLGVWIVYPAWWVLPLFGFLVGYATNWVAIKLIFEPREPKRIVGVKIQGLFHQRQKEVSREFARVSTEDVFTDENLFEELTRADARAKILAVVKEEADAVIERYRKHPLAGGMLTDELVASTQEKVLATVEEEMFREGGVITHITAQSNVIRGLLHERMLEMDPEGFEAVLRPAFQEDEWKLILAGAVLGLGAGILQLVYLFGRSLGG